MTGTYGDSNRYTSSTPHSCPLFPDALEGKLLHPVGPQKSTQPRSRGRRPRLRGVRVPGAETRAAALATPLHCLRRGRGARGGAATHRRASPQTRMPASPTRRRVAGETTAVPRLPWQQPDSFKLQRGIKDGPVHWPRASATWHLIGPRLGGGALDSCGETPELGYLRRAPPPAPTDTEGARP